MVLKWNKKYIFKFAIKVSKLFLNSFDFVWVETGEPGVKPPESAIERWSSNACKK